MRRFILSIISAACLVLAFPNFNLWYLAWVAFVPLFFALEDIKFLQRFFIGYIYGIVFFSGIIWWLFRVTVPGAIVLIFLLSLAPAIFASLARYSKYDVEYAPYIACAWVATEFLRTHLFTGFPWALLGYSQSSNLPVIQIADVTGVYGVSFLIILVNFSLYLLLRKAPGKFYLFFVMLAIFQLVMMYGRNSLNQTVPPGYGLKVAAIQGNIPQGEKWDPRYRDSIIEKYQALTQEALKDNPMLVVWPETALPGYLEDKDLKGQMSDFVKFSGINLLTGTLREEDSSRMCNEFSNVSAAFGFMEPSKKSHLDIDISTKILYGVVNFI